MAKNEEVQAEIDESTELDEYTRSSNTAARIAGLNDSQASFWSSIKTDDFTGRAKVAGLMAASTPLIDHLNEEISLVDIIIQSVEIADEKTGELSVAPRITLIDDNGNAYNATSVGVLSSVEQFVNVIGQPSTWPEPLKVKAVEERGRRGYRFMTLKLV